MVKAVASEHAYNLPISRKIKKLTITGQPTSLLRQEHNFELIKVDRDDLFIIGQAKELVKKVAVDEKGWPVEHYIDFYCNRSQLFVVSYGKEITGVVLVVEGDQSSFPIRLGDSWPNLKLPAGTSAEIPFVVVDKKFRGSSGVSHMLCAACHWHYFESGIDYIELTLDPQLLAFYHWHGMAMEKIMEEEGGGEKTHWGEPSIFPARLYVGDPEKPGSMGWGIRNTRPAMWETFLRCKGLS
jgi:hypothetical protein